MKKRSLIILLFFTSTLVMFSCSETKKNETAVTCDTSLKASSKDAIVNITSGTIAGYVDDGVFTFKGIPYAKAERFMPPVLPDSWEGVRSSRAYGATSPQGARMGWYSDEQAFAFDWNDGFTNEDCFRLNIWTKEINTNSKRPVMVWLHGGGFSAGSSQELPSYDGTNLANGNDVVVVSINHRLNVLGFLDLSAFGGKYSNSSNLGMQDIIASLEWVKSNISKFGGDPNNVTIFGQSGGGGKVTTLLSMPPAKGLFHKAIIQSGAMMSTMTSKASQEIGKRTVSKLGLNASNLQDINKVPYEELLKAANEAVSESRAEAIKNGFEGFIFGFSPTVDGKFLLNQPSEAEALALNADVPVMMGTTIHEFMGSMFIPNGTDEAYTNAIKQRYGEKAEDYIAAFAEAYPNYKPKDLLDVDMNFRLNTWRYSNLRSASSNAPTYSYIFAWESPVLDGLFRSFHCMELPFVFNNIERCKSMTGGGNEAYKLATTVSTAWTNFAKTGNPNAEGLPQWDAYSEDNGATMYFNNHCELKYNNDKKLLEIVDKFPGTSF